MDAERSESIRTGAFGVVPEEAGDPLTEEQVDALPDGSPVTIIWSGGNGPHAGRIVRDGEEGPTYYLSLTEPSDGPLRYYNPVTFVGQERFHTRVWAGDSGRSEGPDGR